MPDEFHELLLPQNKRSMSLKKDFKGIGDTEGGSSDGYQSPTTSPQKKAGTFYAKGADGRAYDLNPDTLKVSDQNQEEMREQREDERMDAILKKIRKKVPAHQILTELHLMDCSYDVFFPDKPADDDV